MHQAIKIQHEHQTSTSANVESLRRQEKNWLVLAGKNKLAAQVCSEKKCLKFLIGENINASSEAKFKKQNL